MSTESEAVPPEVGKAERWGRTMNVLEEVYTERARQFELWGEQNIPFHQPGDHRGVVVVGRSYESMANMIKARCDFYYNRALSGREDWRNNALILLEEVFEALAETDPDKIRNELVQVAAVAVKAIETLDRRREAGEAQILRELGVDLTRYPSHDHGEGLRPCKCGATGQAARCLRPESHNAGCPCPSQEVREAECVINDPFATPAQVAGAEQVLNRAAEDADGDPGVPFIPFVPEVSAPMAGKTNPSGGAPATHTGAPAQHSGRTAGGPDSFAPKSLKLKCPGCLIGDGKVIKGVTMQHAYDDTCSATRTAGGPDDWPTADNPAGVHIHTFDRLHGLCRCGVSPLPGEGS
jgi:hypothetical protein